MEQLFAEVAPYKLIYSLGRVFSHSWLIHIERRRSTRSYGYGTPKSGMEKITRRDLPSPRVGSLLAGASVDIGDL